MEGSMMSLDRAFARFWPVRLLTVSVLAATFAGNAQQASAPQESSAKIDPKVVSAEISKIVGQAIKDTTLKLPDGQTVTTRPLPSSDDLGKVRGFGDQATEVLSRYLAPSNSVMEQQVALRLLDAIGTGRSLDVLGTFAEKAESPFIRSQALFVIASSPRDKDAMLLKKISIDDPDPQVRKQALDLIQRRKIEDTGR